MEQNAGIGVDEGLESTDLVEADPDLGEALGDGTPDIITGAGPGAPGGHV